MLPDIRIGAESIALRLFKTVPGAEENVGRELCKAFGPREKTRGSARLLMAFGDYDVIAVVEGEANRERLMLHGAIPHILGSREIMAFPFSAPGAEHPPNSPLPLLDQGNVYAITFIRPRGFFNCEHKLQGTESSELPDRQFLRWWLDRKVSDQRQTLLGTAGEPAFVAIRVGDTLQEVNEWIAEIGKAGVLVDTTFSIIAIKTPRIPQPMSPRELDPSGEPNVARCGQGISMRLCVSCRPRHTDLLLALAKSMAAGDLTSQTYLPGIEDFSLTMSLGPDAELQRVVDSILDFRGAAAQLLLGTNTAFLDHLVRPPELDSDELAKQVKLRTQEVDDSTGKMLWLPLSAEDAVTISKLPDIGPRTVRAMYQFGNMLQNRAINDRLIDLVAYFDAFRKEASGASPTHVRDLVYLAERLNPARHGIDQRTIGSHAGINPVESHVRHLIGGIHQIIQAAEAIPLAIFERCLDKLWPGFVLEGPLREYWAHFHQVIGLPTSDLWRPNRWVGLVHEAVHCLLHYKGLAFSFTEGPLPGAVEDVRKRLSSIEQILPDLDRAVLEVVVDLIQFNLGPHWKPELQLSWAWEYLLTLEKPELVPKPVGYLFAAKAMCLWASAEEGLLEKDATRAEPPAFHSHYPGLLKTYEGWADSKRLKELGRTICGYHDREINQGLLQALYEGLWPLHRHVARHLWIDAGSVRQRKQWWDGDAAVGCVRQIKDGRTVDAQQITYPDLLVWRLRDAFPNDDMTVPQRTAAILGLQDCYRRSLLAHRDAAIAAAGAGKEATRGERA